MLEIAARSIGGLCGRVLRHSLGMSLEELILRQAVGQPLARRGRRSGAAGVMMIPIPRRGIYHGVEGLTDAQSVPFITGVTITAEPGQIIAPPPDGASYLGFIFARASTPGRCRSGAAQRASPSALRHPPGILRAGNLMTELAQARLEYHERSRHRVNQYAPGPMRLDWADPPDPFRAFRGAFHASANRRLRCKATS